MSSADSADRTVTDFILRSSPGLPASLEQAEDSVTSTSNGPRIGKNITTELISQAIELVDQENSANSKADIGVLTIAKAALEYYTLRVSEKLESLNNDEPKPVPSKKKTKSRTKSRG